MEQTQNQNSLDTRPKPPRAGSKLTLATLAPPIDTLYHRSPLIDPQDRSLRTPIGAENGQNIPQNGSEAKPKGFAAFKTGNLKGLHFGGGGGGGGGGAGNDPNTTQGVVKEGRDTAKRKKPKSNLSKAGTSFLSRVSPCENLSKRLQERKVDGKVAFVNKDRAFLFLDFASNKVGWSDQTVLHKEKMG